MGPTHALFTMAAAALAGSAAMAQDPPSLSVAESDEFGEYIIILPEAKPVYAFTTDTQGTGDGEPAISCSGECLAAWPLVTTEGQVDVGSVLEQERAGTMTHDGQTVLTYNGWPLYTFAKDEPNQPPQGQDVASFGGEWYLLTPAGEPMEEEAEGTGEEATEGEEEKEGD